MTLSTNVSVNQPMNIPKNVPMNQTNTTSPTEGYGEQGSRPPASRHITRALSALSSRIGAVMVALMLTGAAGVAAPAYAGEVIINESNVDQSPFNEPIDGTGRNASGGDDVADGRGGTSALKLALDETREKATVEYLLDDVNTLDHVIALGVLSFDIYPTTTLSGATGGAALKVKCAGSTKYVEITQAEEASEEEQEVGGPVRGRGSRPRCLPQRAVGAQAGSEAAHDGHGAGRRASAGAQVHPSQATSGGAMA